MAGSVKYSVGNEPAHSMKQQKSVRDNMEVLIMVFEEGNFLIK